VKPKQFRADRVRLTNRSWGKVDHEMEKLASNECL
jgi:hypothetical protein